jgi:hypothetical protein
MSFLQVFRCLGLLVLGALTLSSAEPDALAIDAIIQQRHLPYGTILNPIFSKDGTLIVNYTRCGDSALFTGLYLAAEAYRFRATGSPDAMSNLRGALAGLQLLVDVTGNDGVARCAVPADSPYAAGIRSEEAPNGVYSATINGKPWLWIGKTSRDQYTGAFFGLSVAYDLIPDPLVRTPAAGLVTRLLNQLLRTSWNVTMPDGSISTTFLLRGDQQLTFLQIGKQVNPNAFASEYSRNASLLAFTVPGILYLETMDTHSSYFKFNLDFLNLYHLIRLEASDSTRSTYESGFDLVRKATQGHLNAHFNMIDRALHGLNTARDAETRADLAAWLKRPRKDQYVDWRGKIASCGGSNEACQPLPIEQRPPSDFLWQLDPFQLSGGGDGIIETAGVDYILPYWMARYYRVEKETAQGRRLHAGGDGR